MEASEFYIVNKILSKKVKKIKQTKQTNFLFNLKNLIKSKLIL